VHYGLSNEPKICDSGPKFTNDLMTILGQSCDNLGLVTIL